MNREEARNLKAGQYVWYIDKFDNCEPNKQNVAKDGLNEYECLTIWSLFTDNDGNEIILNDARFDPNEFAYFEDYTTDELYAWTNYRDRLRKSIEYDFDDLCEANDRIEELTNETN